MSCPDENGLTEYLEGLLPADAAALIEAHVDECVGCRELLSELAIGDDPSGAAQAQSALTASTPPRRAGRRGSNLLGRGTPVGRYLILGPIGMGGMGIVYSAYDPELHRRVAIKLMRVDGRGRGAIDTRLLREAQLTAQLAHPNVVTVHDVGVFDDQVFLAMEHVDGWTVTAWLHTERRTWRQVLAVFHDAGRGLSAAHEAGLIHRDFKPDNVLIGRDGRVRVTDFGLACREATDDARALSPAERDHAEYAWSTRLVAPITETGALLGTPAYMAPEQQDGLPADARSDQFSFCVTLHEALYGVHPFPASTWSELSALVRSGAITPVSHRGAPAWLHGIVQRGLRPSPADRFPSMNAIASARGRAGRSNRCPLRWWRSGSWQEAAPSL